MNVQYNQHRYLYTQLRLHAPDIPTNVRIITQTGTRILLNQPTIKAHPKENK